VHFRKGSSKISAAGTQNNKKPEVINKPQERKFYVRLCVHFYYVVYISTGRQTNEYCGLFYEQIKHFKVKSLVHLNRVSAAVRF
jgi:hypothetical protein